MANPKEITVDNQAVGQRLDRFLADILDLPRNQVQKALADGQVTVNGQPSKANRRLQAGDRIEILSEISDPGEVPPLVPRPDLKLEIVYQDDDLAVINKPSGMLMHPAVAADQASLAHALVAAFPGIDRVGEAADRPGIMQRLDRDASGLVVVAKTQPAYQGLKSQFQAHTTLKEYDVLVHDPMTQDEGRIDLAIGRHGGGGRMAARSQPREGDRPALSTFRVEERFPKATRLTVRTETGRTHQIRVHLKAIGHPLVGDDLYAKKGVRGQIQLGRLFLHAKRLGFRHPASGRWMEFESPLPPELAGLLERLRQG